MSAIRNLNLSYTFTFLTAFALQILLFTSAAPSPSPNLNNFNIQFNVNNNNGERNRIDPPVEASGREREQDEDVEESAPSVPAPDETVEDSVEESVEGSIDERVGEVENVTVNEDIDDPEEIENRFVIEDEGEDEGENEGENEDYEEDSDNEESEPMTVDGYTIYEAVRENRRNPPEADELLRIDTYEDPSRDSEIEEFYAQTQANYFRRRDQLCPICLTVFERNNGASSAQYEFPSRLDQKLIGFFRRMWEHIESIMVFGSGEALSEQSIYSACDWLVSSDIQRRVGRAIVGTRATINKESKKGIDPTRTVRKLKALQIFDHILNENLDDYNCQDDYSREVAALHGIFDGRYD